MEGIDSFVKILSKGRRKEEGRGKDKKFKSLEVGEASSSHVKMANLIHQTTIKYHWFNSELRGWINVTNTFETTKLGTYVCQIIEDFVASAFHQRTIDHVP